MRFTAQPCLIHPRVCAAGWAASRGERLLCQAFSSQLKRLSRSGSGLRPVRGDVQNKTKATAPLKGGGWMVVQLS